MTTQAPHRPLSTLLRPLAQVVPRGRALEATLLMLAPLLAFLLLRLRAMSPPGILPDPVMHSAYLWDPGDLARRFAPSALPADIRHYVGPAAAYFRWGTRPGFLVPGRLAYLAFGPVPGFLAFRYVLALIATVPAYVLGKRTYGAGIGALAVCLVLASPVVITAWGTDFPDSAAISYVLAGFACLVMPAQTPAARHRWRLGAGALMAAGVWSLATTGLLIAIAVVVAVAQTGVREGIGAARSDLLRLVAGAAAVTAALGLASWLVLGRLDYVLPTLQAVRFLSTPAQSVLWHSRNWRWALGDSYLLVLPATCLAWAALAARRRMPPAAVALGLTAALQLAVAAAGQFGGSLQLLEEHFLSSPLWAASLLALTFVIAELTRPLAARPAARWFPAAAVIAVALVSEAAPRVPAFGWLPWGVVLVGGVVAVVAAAASFPRWLPITGIAATVATLAALLVLTVAPNPSPGTLPRAVFDPVTGYQGALGSGSSLAFADYRLEAAVRRAVPNASYHGEQLMDCLVGLSFLGRQLAGLFHNAVNYMPGRCPDLGRGARAEIRSRNVAQFVAMSTDSPLDVALLLRSLGPLHPRLVRVVHLRSGPAAVSLAVVDFPAAAGPADRP